MKRGQQENNRSGVDEVTGYQCARGGQVTVESLVTAPDRRLRKISCDNGCGGRSCHNPVVGTVRVVEVQLDRQG